MRAPNFSLREALLSIWAALVSSMPRSELPVLCSGVGYQVSGIRSQGSVSPVGILHRGRGGFETRPYVPPLDIGVPGYAGKREGVTGSFKANYRF
jgi:hypothetical protein